MNYSKIITKTAFILRIISRTLMVVQTLFNCDFSVSLSPFGNDFGTLDFGLGLDNNVFHDYRGLTHIVIMAVHLDLERPLVTFYFSS